MRRGNFRTKKAAQKHAAMLRREFPRMKPIRVAKATMGWDVLVSH